jgi:hypothetical protein
MLDVCSGGQTVSSNQSAAGVPREQKEDTRARESVYAEVSGASSQRKFGLKPSRGSSRASAASQVWAAQQRAAQERYTGEHRNVSTFAVGPQYGLNAPELIQRLYQQQKDKMFEDGWRRVLGRRPKPWDIARLLDKRTASERERSFPVIKGIAGPAYLEKVKTNLERMRTFTRNANFSKEGQDSYNREKMNELREATGVNYPSLKKEACKNPQAKRL